MSGCIYRTKDGECELWEKDRNHSPFCNPNCDHKHPSNADRIRSMSDEELADKFEEIQLKTVKAYGNDDLLLKGELKKYWLDWLREKAEGGE